MNKTEEPTPKKRREARERGQVAKSAEFTGVAVVLAAMAVLVFWMPAIVERLLGVMLEALSLASRPDLASEQLGPFFMQAIDEIAWLLFPLLGLAFLAAGFITFVQVGPLFTLEPLRPKGERLDPVQGFTELFGVDRLVELAKHVGKLVVMAGIAGWTIAAWMPEILSMLRVDLGDGLWVLQRAVLTTAFGLVAGLVFFGIVDLLWKIHRHHESLKMTKREVEEEHKASEGDPELAGKRKQMHREMLNETGRPDDVRTADAVVVNPTHYAVGLQYDADQMAAPEVVASGRGVRAKTIKKMARKFRVPVIHNVTLARSLYRDGELHEAIPPEYYEPVAEVLKFAYSLADGVNTDRDRGADE